MSEVYSLYGLRLVANRPLPFLAVAADSYPADFAVFFDVPPPPAVGAERLRPWAPPGFERAADEIAYGIQRDDEGRLFRFTYADGTEFTIDLTAGTVWASWPPNLTVEDAIAYFVGPVMGFILRARSVVCLHASCVVDDGHAFAITGSAGAGKSTTAAAFARMGVPVLSDDVTALHPAGNEFLALPGYPRLCLWPQSATALYGDADALPWITPNWEKRHLDLRETRGQFMDSPAPLRAVYLLRDRAEEEGRPRLNRLSPGSALVTLVGHTYGNRLLDAAARADEFAVLGRLVASAPVREVFPHSSVGRLADLCDVILGDFRAAVASPAGFAGSPG